MKHRSFSPHTLSLALLLCLASTSQAFFNPTVGKWASRDPIGERGELNLHGFVRNNPVTFVDRLGLSPATPGAPAPDLYDIKNKFQAWYDEQKKKGTAWNNDLPACPCKLEKRKCTTIVLGEIVTKTVWQNPDSAIWGDPSDPNTSTVYHPGAANCIRSKAKSIAGPGEQCCYDATGKLITSGLGAGSADSITPGVTGVIGHYFQDVEPWEWAKQLDGAGVFGQYMTMYFEMRPANNKNKCEKNDAVY